MVVLVEDHALAATQIQNRIAYSDQGCAFPHLNAKNPSEFGIRHHVGRAWPQAQGHLKDHSRVQIGLERTRAIAKTALVGRHDNDLT